jgi:hypothetical protein
MFMCDAPPQVPAGAGGADGAAQPEVPAGAGAATGTSQPEELGSGFISSILRPSASIFF